MPRKGDKVVLVEGLLRTEVTFLSKARDVVMIKDSKGKERYVDKRMVSVQSFCLHCASPFLAVDNENFCSLKCRSEFYD